MNKKTFKTFFSTILIGTALALTGCGGGGGGGGTAVQTYTGNISAAKVDSTNASQIGTNAGAAVKVGSDALNTQYLPTGVTINGTSNLSSLDTLSQKLANFIRNQATLNFPTGASISGSCGGSMSFSGTSYPSSGPYQATITYSNFCDSTIDPTMSFSGALVFYVPDVTLPYFTMTFSNFVITQNSNSLTVNSIILTYDSTGFTFSSDYVGADGQIYRATNFLGIYGDTTIGLSGTMTFYDPTYGYVNITANTLTYGSCGDFPDGGSIDISDTAGDTASITFYPPSPCTYTGTFTPIGGAPVSVSGNTP